MNSTVRKGLAAALACIVLSACQQNRIEGVVETINGQALPGVSVTVESQGRHALTNTRGEYAVSFVPGNLTLRYIKSGYTPGELRLEVDEYRQVQAETVRLWRLPPDQGVFLYTDGRYTAADPIIPEKFVTTDGIRYGTKKQRIEPWTEDTTPTLITYTAQRQGIALSRLERQTLTLTGEGVLETDIEAWSPVNSQPVNTAPIDEPEHVLLEILLPGELEHGIYAVHWGALEGETKTESRMFVFRVGPEETAAEEEEGEEGAEQSDSGPSEG